VGSSIARLVSGFGAAGGISEINHRQKIPVWAMVDELRLWRRFWGQAIAHASAFGLMMISLGPQPKRASLEVELLTKMARPVGAEYSTSDRFESV